jgi:PIN domain nuclease of toxin-antitoxin system
LLDTHIWIWIHRAPDNIPLGIVNALRQEPLCISSISVWEALMALEKGRVTSSLSPERTTQSWLDSNPISVVPIGVEVATLARTLQFAHSDPADRFIAATAYHLNCQLATVDEQLKQLPWLKVLPD